MDRGRIFMIPVPLGGIDFRSVIPENVLTVTKELRHFAVEDLRSARRYLRLIDRSFPIDDSVFFELSEHTKPDDVKGFLKLVKEGSDLGVLSEAGIPGVADPGALIAAAAHSEGIKVVPLSGPSSVLLGLAASGLNGQNFRFHGYLPVKEEQRISKLKELDKHAGTGETQIFIETPYRAAKMFESILVSCAKSTALCVAADITLPGEMIRTRTVGQWQGSKTDMNGRLTVFLLGRL